MIYHLEFTRPAGAPLGVVAEMARYDNADVLGVCNDSRCRETNVRRATLRARRRDEPTMARWASFVVGARIVHKFFYSDPEGRTHELLAADDAEAFRIASSRGHEPTWLQRQYCLRDGTLSVRSVRRA